MQDHDRQPPRRIISLRIKQAHSIPYKKSNVKNDQKRFVLLFYFSKTDLIFFKFSAMLHIK